MRCHILNTLLMCGALFLFGAACSDDNGNTPTQDGGGTVKDGQAGGDAFLYGCLTPGKSCNAHNPCAINPICGKDLLCRPERLQDCSDDLDCTTDRCTGPGMCENKPSTGWCALMVPDPKGGDSVRKCLKPGMPESVHPKDPCKSCDPTTSGTQWSPTPNYLQKKCDDSTVCTVNDVCKDGVCAGTYYGSKCADGLGCTDDKCDGKGGCSNPMKSGYCLINNACYKTNTYDVNGCGYCDPNKSLSAWTPTPDICKVGIYCYPKGKKDSSGCGVCDPTQSTTGWSAASDKCLIGGICFAKGDKHSSGCAECTPATSKTAWTPVASKCWISGGCYVSGGKSATGCGVCDPTKTRSAWTPVASATSKASGFESGLSSFTVSAAVQGVGWHQSTARFVGGKGSLHFGSKTAGNYDTGAVSSGTAKSPAYTLTAGKKAALTFWLYMDTETTDKFDVLTVSAGGSVIWTKSASTMPAANYKRWVQVEVDLTSLAGKAINITFTFDTKDSWANDTEGVYLDDVKVVYGCS